ncbi:hypothetical protein KHC33_01170 [Methanospirillum sp. J.3.6.1-F.2.7.3]|uniref:Flagellin n=1 Tax=Methanospirillum purgamenti TaxID=2834276 RepID=A0A8E7B2D7_9EURY|nr:MULTISPECIES: flagellin [Methanospirillum]MDX8551865.1 flagellin [Methanospirillum hungatei]QVV89177.1 hypothetical protein KHC33_01170 [Methanospirillum sp. J.3.6.1-F.2.7.3]
MKRDLGFSGLESAIILIAFVVVASVFAYTILGSGFFATQKAQTVTQESTTEASAVMYPEGGIYGSLYSGGTYDGQLETVSFTLTIPPTGMAQDLNENIIIYTQKNKDGTITGTPRTYTFSGSETPSGLLFGVERGDTDPIMQPGERRAFYMAELEGPVPGGFFTIETKPKNGVGAFIQKSLPPAYSGGIII